MRLGWAACVWLTCSSVAWAQPANAWQGPSITDAQLELLCADAARADISAQPETPTAGRSDIDEVQKDLDSLQQSERKALAAMSDANDKQRPAARDNLQSIRDQRETTERTLRDLRAADQQRSLRNAVKSVDTCDTKTAEQKQQVCDAYRRHAVIPWDAATAVTKCLNDEKIDQRGLRMFVDQQRDESRALTGSSLETAILQGTADFLVERSEQELATFSVQLLKEKLCKQDTKPAAMFSRTCKLIDSEQDGDFSVPLAALREAVRADIEALPEWLASNVHGSAQKPAACALEVSWKFSERVLRGEPVVATLSDLGSIVDELKGKEPCASSASLITKLADISKAFGNTANAPGVDVAGLVRAGELNSVVSRGDRTLTNPNSTDLSSKGQTVREVLQRVRDLLSALDRLKEDGSAANRAAVVSAALRTVEPLLTYAGDTKPVAYLETVSAIVTDLGNRQYIAAVVTLSASDLLKDALDDDKAGKNVRVLITLGATIAQADSSDAVKAALEEAAAPLQSWRRKNLPRFGATVTGMLGVIGGYELPVERTKLGEKAPSGGTLAPSLNLGVDFHRGLGTCARLGVLLNVFDLGALATVRLGNVSSGVERSSQVRFEQVLAPALAPYVGAGPIDVGVALGFVPALRPVFSGEPRNIESLNVVRVGLFVALDVSVLPLF